MMAHHLIPRDVDARYSTHFNANGDVYNYYGVLPTHQNPYASSPSPWNQPPPPFMEIPVKIISSHFTGRDEELDRIGKALDMVYGSVPARCAIHGMTGMSHFTYLHRILSLLIYLDKRLK
jgi:hypothetical protein